MADKGLGNTTRTERKVKKLQIITQCKRSIPFPLRTCVDDYENLGKDVQGDGEGLLALRRCIAHVLDHRNCKGAPAKGWRLGQTVLGNVSPGDWESVFPVFLEGGTYVGIQLEESKRQTLRRLPATLRRQGR